MLSKDCIWCLKFYFHCGKRFYASPLQWDPDTRVVTVSRTLIWWKIIAVTLISYFLFAFVRLVHAFSILGLPLEDCIIPFYFVITSFFFATAHLSYWFSYDDHAAFWTKFLQFDAAHSGPNFNGEQKDKLGFFLKGLTLLGYTHMAFQGAAFLAIRKSPNFVYSIIWEVWGVDSVYLMIPFVVFEMLVIFYSWAATLHVDIGILLFPSSVTNWNNYINSHSTRVWKNKKAHYYRCLQVLASNYTAAFSPIAIPRQEFSVLFGGIICTYATVKLYTKLHPCIYLTMPISIFIMIFYEKYFHGCSAKMQGSSQKLLRIYEVAMLTDAQEEYEGKLRLHREQTQLEMDQHLMDEQKQVLTKLQTKTWRSFQPLGIAVHKFYSIQPSTIITFGSLVLANAINLLVA